MLDRYPPKDPALAPRAPPPSAMKPTPAPSPAAAPPTPTSLPKASESSAPKPLIALERPFSVDEFAELLGETNIQVNVPREDLAEVLRRVADFMGFGIYVYSFRVRPGPSDLLKQFVLELTRVDYSAAKQEWVPFQDKGRSDSPFGPTGQR